MIRMLYRPSSALDATMYLTECMLSTLGWKVQNQKKFRAAELEFEVKVAQVGVSFIQENQALLHKMVFPGSGLVLEVLTEYDGDVEAWIEAQN